MQSNRLIRGDVPQPKTIHGEDEREEAVCRGFYDRHMTIPLIIARSMDAIAFQTPKKKGGKAYETTE